VLAIVVSLLANLIFVLKIVNITCYFAVPGNEACVHAVTVMFTVIPLLLTAYASFVFKMGTPLNLIYYTISAMTLL